MGELFVVASPIGNLSDITIRALEILRSCDRIACEDTRHTSVLLKHFGIEKPLISCRARNECEASVKILQVLDKGEKFAFVSVGGTPGVSDPGSLLVAKAREKGHTIIPIPGVSACTTLISVVGIPFKSFIFEGFLPQKGLKRQKRLQELLSTGCAVVLYESPYRIIKLFEELVAVEKILGLDKKGKNMQAIVGRELTKIHEQLIRGSVAEVLQKLSTETTIKGEFCVFVTIN